MDWTTIIAVVALGGVIGYGLWCASKALKGAVDDIWNMLGF